jgi:predicted ATPase/class 3 adenylate cyclase
MAVNSRCPRCSAENEGDARFCEDCGFALSLLCPRCGAAVTPGKRFCRECGAEVAPASSPPLDRESAPPAAPQRVAERRLVSVLFADLVGFTSLSESQDAEDVRELLARYFDTCRTVITRYGGVVEKFIGDAVMAVWGTPVANEDDAERAVRAALDLVAAVSALGSEVGAPSLAARAGVLTGEAAVTIGASGEGMVAGDLVNTASRLQSAAEHGAVVVGESTRLAAGNAIAFADLGELNLKGKNEAVHAWRALRVVARRRGLGRSEGLEPPFMGRDGELRMLKDLLDATGRERRARLVSVSGVPGVGKSRLAWEFLKYVDGLVDAVFWHQGRCPAYGDGITFWPLGEMVRRRAGISEGEEPAAARVKLASSVAEFVDDATEQRWLEPRLAHLLGLADSAPGQQEELFSAWRTFFERISDRGPTVMVVEDLQWADPGLIEFVESILEWSRNQPILVITLARPELMDRHPTWGAGQRNFTALHLEPLGDDDMRTLIRSLIADLPETLEQQMLARAEGIPLYAVETVRMLIDRRELLEQDGRYRVAGELSALTIPQTLHALIASRLDALPPEERALVQEAAVLGKTFSVSALTVLTHRKPDELEPLLRDLVRKELLSIDNDPRSPERGQYGFVQSVIREVAYGTLSRRDREQKHLAAAGYFESLADPELTGVVAAHYVEAQAALPEGPERDALGALAQEWLKQAGERALSLGSPEQALRYFEQTLQLTAAEDQPQLVELVGMAARDAAQPERAIGFLERATALYQQMGDAAAAARVASPLISAIGYGGERYSEGVDRGQAAFAAVPEDAPSEVAAALAERIAALLHVLGRNREGLEWTETALALAERADDAKVIAKALAYRAGCLFNLGRPREAFILFRGAVAVAERAGPREQSEVLLALSIYGAEDDLREAFSAAVQAAELARRAGYRPLELMNLGNAAELAIWLGELEVARARVDEWGQRELTGANWRWLKMLQALLTGLTENPAHALLPFSEIEAEAETNQRIAEQSTFWRSRALVELAAGDVAAAHESAARAVAAEPSGLNTAQALAVQGRAALALRDPGKVREALSAMRGFRGRWMATIRRENEAGLAALEGHTEQAVADFRLAIEEFTSLDTPLDLALCHLSMSLLLEGEPAETSAAEARRLFARMGAVPLLERIPELSAAAAAAG